MSNREEKIINLFIDAGSNPEKIAGLLIFLRETKNLFWTEDIQLCVQSVFDVWLDFDTPLQALIIKALISMDYGYDTFLAVRKLYEVCPRRFCRMNIVTGRLIFDNISSYVIYPCQLIELHDILALGNRYSDVKLLNFNEYIIRKGCFEIFNEENAFHPTTLSMLLFQSLCANFDEYIHYFTEQEFLSKFSKNTPIDEIKKCISSYDFEKHGKILISEQENVYEFMFQNGIPLRHEIFEISRTNETDIILNCNTTLEILSKALLVNSHDNLFEGDEKSRSEFVKSKYTMEKFLFLQKYGKSMSEVFNYDLISVIFKYFQGESKVVSNKSVGIYIGYIDGSTLEEADIEKYLIDVKKSRSESEWNDEFTFVFRRITGKTKQLSSKTKNALKSLMNKDFFTASNILHLVRKFTSDMYEVFNSKELEETSNFHLSELLLSDLR